MNPLFPFPHAGSLSLQVIAVLILLALCGYDLRERRLPNFGVLGFIGLYFLEAATLRTAWLTIGSHVAIGVLALGVAMVLYRAGWMGGGDVKLAGAVFLWAGPAICWTIFCLVSFAGCALALSMLALSRVAGRAPRLARCTTSYLDVARGVPYGVALACGGAWAVLEPAVNLFNF